ncbi:MAG: DUF3524 domain-containing protein [Pseudomonadales bacterium]
MSKPKALLLSAYDAQSHQYWRTQLCDWVDTVDWTVLTLPARNFAWQFRSNALQWTLSNKEALQQRYDLILASSMVDLAGLLGLTPGLAGTPSVLYFHENQFAYPQGASQHSTVELQLSSVISAMAATQLVFNSEFNRQSFLMGAHSFLKKMPGAHARPVSALLGDKTRVLQVPLKAPQNKPTPRTTPSARPVSIVWNHRWEFDKGPERLLAFTSALLKTEIEFVLHVMGQQFRGCPDEFPALHKLLNTARPHALGQWGFVDDQQLYQNMLNQADFVLSTALHDFQGLSVLEAVQRGCRPLLPRRLAYPEWCPDEFLYDSEPDDVVLEASNAVSRFVALLANDPPVPSVASLEWQTLGPEYKALIQRLCEQC